MQRIARVNTSRIRPTTRMKCQATGRSVADVQEAIGLICERIRKQGGNPKLLETTIIGSIPNLDLGRLQASVTGAKNLPFSAWSPNPDDTLWKSAGDLARCLPPVAGVSALFDTPEEPAKPAPASLPILPPAPASKPKHTNPIEAGVDYSKAFSLTVRDSKGENPITIHFTLTGFNLKPDEYPHLYEHLVLDHSQARRIAGLSAPKTPRSAKTTKTTKPSETPAAPKVQVTECKVNLVCISSKISHTAIGKGHARPGHTPPKKAPEVATPAAQPKERPDLRIVELGVSTPGWKPGFFPLWGKPKAELILRPVSWPAAKA